MRPSIPPGWCCLLAVAALPLKAQVPEARGGPTEPAVATAACEVTRIVDGDTIECRPGVRVRLIGMDTPEMNQAPFGRLARDTLAALIPIGTTVRLEVLCAARSAAELREDVGEVGAGPLDAARLDDVRRFGDAVHAAARGGRRWMFR